MKHNGKNRFTVMNRFLPSGTGFSRQMIEIYVFSEKNN